MKKIAFRLTFFLGLAAAAGCADGLEPVPFQGVSGAVTFVGAPPDSTDWVRLAVYRHLPQTPIDLLDFVAFSDTLPIQLDTAPYVFALDTGTYEWLPVVWKARDAPLIPSALRVIGWYSGGGAPFDPALPFTVGPDRETAAVDLTGDFGSLLTVDSALKRLGGGG